MEESLWHRGYRFLYSLSSQNKPETLSQNRTGYYLQTLDVVVLFHPQEYIK